MKDEEEGQEREQEQEDMEVDVDIPTPIPSGHLAEGHHVLFNQDYPHRSSTRESNPHYNEQKGDRLQLQDIEIEHGHEEENIFSRIYTHTSIPVSGSTKDSLTPSSVRHSLDDPDTGSDINDEQSFANYPPHHEISSPHPHHLNHHHQRNQNLDSPDQVTPPPTLSGSSRFSRPTPIPVPISIRSPSPYPNPPPTSTPSAYSRFRPSPSPSFSPYHPLVSSTLGSAGRPSPRPLVAAAASYTSSRHSPYRIPLPLSSARSTMSEATIHEQAHKTAGPSAPTTPPRRNSKSSNVRDREANGDPSPHMVSPLGSISTSRRRQPPAWPSSPRRDVPAESHQSHRTIIAKSAGYYTPAAYFTPSTLKAIIPQYSPAIRPGYSYVRPHSTRHGRPYPVVSPGVPIPHTAHPHSQAYPSSSTRRPAGGNSTSAPHLLSPAPVHSATSPHGGIGPHGGNSPHGRVLTITPTSRGVQYQNVPQAWVVRELNQNAQNVWFRPESTDCRVIVPIWSVLAKRKTRSHKSKSPQIVQDNDITPTSAPSLQSQIPHFQRSDPNQPHGPIQPLGTPAGQDLNSGISRGREDVVWSHQVERNEHRRGSESSNTDQIPVIIFPLHQDYLVTQSKLFRLLLGSIPSQTDMESPDSPPGATRPLRKNVLEGDPDPTTPLPEGMLKGAKVMSTPKEEVPAVYVPLPDPGAFGVIVHWLYWGDATAVETALSKGMVNWQGLVHNIDFLDMDDTIKRIVGKWWRKWIKTESSHPDRIEDDEADGEGYTGSSSDAEDADELDDLEDQGDTTGVEVDGDEDGMEIERGHTPYLGRSPNGNEGTEDIPTVRGKKVPAEIKASRWIGRDGDLDEATGRLERL